MTRIAVFAALTLLLLHSAASSVDRVAAGLDTGLLSYRKSAAHAVYGLNCRLTSPSASKCAIFVPEGVGNGNALISGGKINQTVTLAAGANEVLINVPAAASPDNSDIATRLSVQGLGNFAFQTWITAQVVPPVVYYAEMDKDEYSPGETVKIRVIALDSDTLLPVTGSIELTIKDPDGTVVATWKESMTTKGLWSTEYPLGDEAKEGQWRLIKQKSDENYYYLQQVFNVRQQELPDLELMVSTPVSISCENSTFTVSIEARSITGRTVNSNGTVEMLWDGYAQGKTVTSFVLPASGKTNLSIAISEQDCRMQNWGQWHTYTPAPASLQLRFRISNAASGINGTAVAAIPVDSFSLSLSSYMTINSTRVAFYFTLDPQGSGQHPPARVNITTDCQNYSYIATSFQSELVDIVPGSSYVMKRECPFGYPILHATKEYIGQNRRWKDPSDNWLYYAENQQLWLVPSGSEFPVGATATFAVMSQEANITVMFEVATRGKPVQTGTLRLTGNNGTLSIPITEQLKPTFTVTVIRTAGNGGAQGVAYIGSEVQLRVTRDYFNKVNITYSPSKVFENDDVLVRVQGPPNSLVAISVVDHRFLSNFNGSSVSNHIDTDTWLDLYFGQNSARKPIEQRRKRAIETGPTNASLTNGETFWVEKRTDATGIATITLRLSLGWWGVYAYALSDTSGLCVANTWSIITVEPRDLHLSLQAPTRVVRGETFLAHVTVVNRAKQPANNVRVMIKNSTDLLLTLVNASSPSDPTKDFALLINTIPAESEVTVSFPLKPVHLGLFDIVVAAFYDTWTAFSDQLIRVIAEGVPVSPSYSVMVDLRVNSTFNQVVNTTMADNAVSDTGSTTITIYTEMLRASVDGLEKLITMPSGCGEQNLILLTPTIFVSKYLQTTNQFQGEMRDHALSYMLIGYQRELNYRHSDGSFSAFGDSDASGSTWLTAFALRSFRHASEFITIDDNVMTIAENWLLAQQQADGHFSEPGRVIHVDMQGGVNSQETMTAFVLIAFLEKNASSLQPAKKASAVSFIEQRLTSVTDMGALAIITYALHLANSVKANDAFTKLNVLRTTTAKDTYWQSATGSTSRAIETTSYALMIYLRRNMDLDAFPIASWLLSKRNSLGGYQSTQDTVLALQALAEYFKRTSGSAQATTATVTITADANQTTYTLTPATANVTRQWKLSFVPKSVGIVASGSGMFIVQISTNYNVIPVTTAPSTGRRRRAAEPSISVGATLVTDTLAVLVVNVCPRSTSVTGMAIVQIDVPSGYEVTQSAIDRLKSANVLNLKRVELNDGQLVLYYDSLYTANYCATVEFNRASDVVGTKAVFVRVTDYYSPEVTNSARVEPKAAQKASVCDLCGSSCSGCQNSAVSVVEATFPAASTTAAATTATTRSTTRPVSSSSTASCHWISISVAFLVGRQMAASF